MLIVSRCSVLLVNALCSAAGSYGDSGDICPLRKINLIPMQLCRLVPTWFENILPGQGLPACFPCHGKTRVNGGRQKAKTAGVLMNLSRLRQLGPQQFTKKDRRRLARQAFFNYLCSSSRYYYFSDFDILPRCIYWLSDCFLAFFLANTISNWLT